MMKTFLSAGVIGILLSACEPSAPGAAMPPTADPAAPSDGMQPGQQRVDTRDQATADSPMFRDSDNMSSALRFAETNEQTTLWGGLLRQSKWAKEVHNNPYVFLAVTNDRLAGKENLIKLLQQQENKALLDEIMASHLVKPPFLIDKDQSFTEVETIDGRRLKVDAGQNRIGGALYGAVQVSTMKGSVVHMLEPVYFPEDQLKKQAAAQK